MDTPSRINHSCSIEAETEVPQISWPFDECLVRSNLDNLFDDYDSEMDTPVYTVHTV